jgi:hypothetical protein
MHRPANRASHRGVGHEGRVVLRALVILLLLVNLLFYSWTQGWLDGVVGARATGDREPERLARQVRPESVRILPPATGGGSKAPSSSSVAIEVAASEGESRPLACLEAGPFTDVEINAAQSKVQSSLPVGSWASVKVDVPGVWMIYMGKYANREALAKKEEELKRRKLDYEELLDNPAYAPGLSLGRYDTRASANQAFDQFAIQGIHTGRVVEMTPASSRHLLRVDKADANLANQLATLSFDPSGKGFVPCATTTPGN